MDQFSSGVDHITQCEKSSAIHFKTAIDLDGVTVG
jgi:hypothetical protein